MSVLRKVADVLQESGTLLHLFRSGGGLRVARFERGGETGKRGNGLAGYGEHFNVEEALRHAAEDFRAGGRPYDEVYGEGKLYDHYLTGTTERTCDLDAHLLRGNAVDAWWDKGAFFVEAHGYDPDTYKPVVRQGVAETLRGALIRAGVEAWL